MKRFLLVLCLLIPTPGWSAVAFDTAVNAGTGSGNTSVSNTITIAVNTNRILLYAIGVQDQVLGVVTSVTGAGATWSKVGATNLNGNMRGELWVGLAPSTGSQTATANFTGITTGACETVLMSLYNVNQTTPTNGYVAVTANPDTVTVASGDMAGSFSFDSNSNQTVSGTGVTQDLSTFGFIGVAAGHGVTSPTTTFTWSGYNANSGVVSCNVVQVSAGGGCVPRKMLLGVGAC